MVYAANKASYERHKTKYQRRARERNARLKQKALEAHGSTACERCGYDVHPSALDFHHRNPAEKLFNISVALQAPDKYSWNEILSEIAKCDVICSNCHDIEHTVDVQDPERFYALFTLSELAGVESSEPHDPWIPAPKEVQHATSRGEDYYGQKGKHKRKK